MRRLVIGSIIGGLFLGGSLLFRIGLSQPVLAQSTGSITGRVVLVGDTPQPKKLEITKDKEKCGTDRSADDLVVSSDRGIKNAVVSILGAKGKATKVDKNPTLDQKGCGFNPRVIVVPAGAPVDILNSDGILHNIHTYSSKNPAINKAQPAFRKKMTETFAQPEIIKVTCDAHPWMLGWIVVSDHSYAETTDSGGAFKLADVPPGAHKVEVWHEVLGKVTKEVTVKAGEETKVTFELSKK